MSAALVNRSLTTIRTELEFLKDSDVITEGLYEKLIESLPVKYQKDSAPWDVDKLATGSSDNNNGAIVPKVQNKSSTDVLADDLAQTSISVPPPAYPPAQPPRESPSAPRPLGYCIATYDYNAQQDGDLNLTKNDKLAIVEHLSEDWWKGYKSTTGPEKTGVFPSNYVKTISELEYESKDKKSEAPYQQQAGYSAYGSPAPYQQAQPPIQQQPSYGGYAQYPPPSTNYYPPQQYQPPAQQQQPQQQVVQQEQPQQQGQQHSHGGEHLKKFGSKFGNAAIFGAGATVGSNIINSIF